MNTRYKIALAVLAGAALGAAAVQGLHAQAQPPAYIVLSIQKITNPAGFKVGVADKANPADLRAAGGHFVIRSRKFTSVDGTPPTLFVVQRFESTAKARAFLNTPIQKEIHAALAKTTNSLSFIVEGAGD